jgi:sensor histidine kinase YesM
MPANNKPKVSTHLKGIIAVTLIGTAISLMMTPAEHMGWRQLGINMLYCFLIGAFLWFGNFSVDPILNTIFGKDKLSPGRKLVFSLTGMILISSALIFVVNWFWVVVLWGSEFDQFIMYSGKMIMIIELVVVVIVALVLYINEFFYSWRESVKKEESLKREKLALEYESLKNQVNPHFLFNSLNSLSGLIGKDDGKATRFVKQLSDIYRYVLEHKDRELVSLETEMQFVENFISLMKIRFGDNLIVETTLEDKHNRKVIPLSIQMLVENAIKHNIVSKERPLTITITTSGEYQLEVRNNLQKKSSILQEEEGDWEKHGLVNLKSRYEYLGNNKFEVNGSSKAPFPADLDGDFVVRVPLLD